MSRAILEWLQGAGIATALNDPGKPGQNGADESFNGKFRDECLSLEWFRNRIDAKLVIERWPQGLSVFAEKGVGELQRAWKTPARPSTRPMHDAAPL